MLALKMKRGLSKKRIPFRKLFGHMTHTWVNGFKRKLADHFRAWERKNALEDNNRSIATK